MKDVALGRHIGYDEGKVSIWGAASGVGGECVEQMRARTCEGRRRKPVGEEGLWGGGNCWWMRWISLETKVKKEPKEIK